MTITFRTLHYKGEDPEGWVASQYQGEFDEVVKAKKKLAKTYSSLRAPLEKIGRPDLLAFNSRRHGVLENYKFVEVKNSSGLQPSQVNWIRIFGEDHPVDIVYLIGDEVEEKSYDLDLDVGLDEAIGILDQKKDELFALVWKLDDIDRNKRRVKKKISHVLKQLEMVMEEVKSLVDGQAQAPA